MDVSGGGSGTMDAGRYCREIESFLCRKNDGHLIRIVGPAFELVSGWAAQGIPLRVVFEGIDRFFERYYRKGPRRRPVHIAFCEGDVLDAFDAWRRATGVGVVAASAGTGRRTGDEAAGGPPAPGAAPSSEGAVSPGRRRGSLAAHVERTIAMLTARRAGAPPELDGALEGTVRELDLIRAEFPAPRGEARERVLDRLRALDERLLLAARPAVNAGELQALIAEAEESLAPFRQRMPEAAWSAARAAALDRAIRSALRLPVVAFPEP